MTDIQRIERDLIGALADGRAVLMLGQNHSPEVMPRLLSDVAAALNADNQGSLRRQLVDRVEGPEIPNVRRALSLHTPSDQLLELAGQPWSMVITSAVDTVAAEAFRHASSRGRRLRLLFPSQTGGQLTKATRDVLTVVRLFGSLEEQEERYLPPLTERALRQRRSFEVAGMLDRLPLAVGPHGCLVVVGVDADDWLDLEDLALACSHMLPGTVHWFNRSIPDQVRRDLGDALIAHAGSVQDLLARHAATAEGQALNRAAAEIQRPSARSLTLSGGGRAPTSLSLTLEDWRNVSQVGLLLDDDAIRPVETISPDEIREAFRAFLRHQQYVPDWAGVARGFVFEREQGPTLVDDCERRLLALGSVHDPGTLEAGEGEAVAGSRVPFLLTGPPACGKSRLLHWLAFRLRTRGHAVLWLVTPAGRVHFESVERACRILESKGAPVVVVFADGLDASTYGQLNEHLASSGRNALVIGARSGLQAEPPSGEKPSDVAQFRAVPVAATLTPPELARFRTYLSEQGFGDVVLGLPAMGERYFLLLLYRLLPDARGNIHLSLTGEYDRLLATLDRIQEEDTTEANDDPWRRQLAVAREALFPETPDGSSAQRSTLAHLEGGERAVNLSLFCSQIGKPLPLDLLLRTEGHEFLRRYRDFSAALEATAMLQEVEVDRAGTVVLDADHPVVAQLTLASVMPRRSDQVRLLRALVDAVAWDETAFPGDRPEQDYCVEVLQAVGPRGLAEREFQSQPALEAVAELLARVRTEHSVRLPRLLLLEANTLRLLADRLSVDHATGLRRCEEALEVLGVAEQILAARRATGARNTELRNVLSTRAAVHGFVVGNLLREYRKTSQLERPPLRARIFSNLAEVDRLALQSRGLGTPSFYPLDVTFWAYRDTLQQLPDLSEEERVHLLERMQEVLDSAREEPIEGTQADRFQRRSVNLAQLEGDVPLSEALASRMRERGDFSGECLLVRGEAFESGTRRARSREAAVAGLARLESFGAAVYGSGEALNLMHHLWMAAFLPDQHVGGPDPVFARCSEEDWTRWRRILDARARVLGPGQNLFLGFCLSWTLFELGEPRLALQEIRAVEPLSGGSRRRVGCLVVLTDGQGNSIRFRGAVRRREGDAVVVYVSTLIAEVRLSPGMASRFPVLPHVGDELELEIGLNYRGLLPWRLP